MKLIGYAGSAKLQLPLHNGLLARAPRFCTASLVVSRLTAAERVVASDSYRLAIAGSSLKNLSPQLRLLDASARVRSAGLLLPVRMRWLPSHVWVAASLSVSQRRVAVVLAAAAVPATWLCSCIIELPAIDADRHCWCIHFGIVRCAWYLRPVAWDRCVAKHLFTSFVDFLLPALRLRMMKIITMLRVAASITCSGGGPLG